MKSIKDVYKIGHGPSSSHTMAPARAGMEFYQKNKNCDFFKIYLYGSLAHTGKGHLTDEILKKVFNDNVEIVFDFKTRQPHSNTFEMFAFEKGEQKDYAKVFSVGGGDFVVEGQPEKEVLNVYPHSTFEEIRLWCIENKKSLVDYVKTFESSDICQYVANVWTHMKKSIDNGLSDQGILPGALNVQKRAKALIEVNKISEPFLTRQNRILSAYAFAVSEQNASGGKIVTAPTCGSAGVIPAVFYYVQQFENYTDDEIISALMCAGLFGTLVKTNASVSGAECGCQAEIGTACSMASAGLAYLRKMSIEQIEYSAEIAMEHYLGLTCDPVCGLVQIPCIERNAVSTMRAINAVTLAEFLTDSRKVSFDVIVQTMYQTGKDMHGNYRETAKGGLAKHYNETDSI